MSKLELQGSSLDRPDGDAVHTVIVPGNEELNRLHISHEVLKASWDITELVRAPVDLSRSLRILEHAGADGMS